jgi:hypothetical protein
MYSKLIKNVCTLILSVMFLTGSANSAYAISYTLTNSFDNLNNLVPGPTSFITLDNGIYQEGSGSVKMTWNGDVNDRGYFDWVLPGTPDFTNTKITFDAYPPPFISEISLELIDANGNIAQGWLWNVQPGMTNQFNTLTVVTGAQSGASSYSVGNGDITQIARLRFDERSINGGLSYNYWDSASVQPVPEPTTMVLLGTGLAGLIGSRRKKNLAA